MIFARNSAKNYKKNNAWNIGHIGIFQKWSQHCCLFEI